MNIQPKEYINNNKIPFKVDENSHSEDMAFVINTTAEQVIFTEVLLNPFHAWTIIMFSLTLEII